MKKLVIGGNTLIRYWSPAAFYLHTAEKECEIIATPQNPEDVGILDVLAENPETKPDLILYIDDHKFHKLWHCSKISNIPKAFVISDTHRSNKEWIDLRIDMAQAFDFIFVNQKSAVDLFRNKYPNKFVGWLPHAFFPVITHPMEWEKKYDVGAVSYMNDKRLTLYPMIEKNFRFKNVNGIWAWSATKFMSQCKMIINQTLSNDMVNIRTFETLGCRLPLLQNRCEIGVDLDDNGLFDLFKDGEDLFTYATFDEAIEKIRWIIEHYDKAIEVAANGFSKAINKHTYSHRIDTILKVTGLK